jgi:hypothetical protein
LTRVPQLGERPEDWCFKMRNNFRVHQYSRFLGGYKEIFKVGTTVLTEKAEPSRAAWTVRSKFIVTCTRGICSLRRSRPVVAVATKIGSAGAVARRDTAKHSQDGDELLNSARSRCSP